MMLAMLRKNVKIPALKSWKRGPAFQDNTESVQPT
jgi:hypothetical protein